MVTNNNKMYLKLENLRHGLIFICLSNAYPKSKDFDYFKKNILSNGLNTQRTEIGWPFITKLSE